MTTIYTKVVAGENCLPHYCRAHKRNKIFKFNCNNSGFSLIELCITLGILAIILSTASSNFTQFINKIKVRTTSNDIQSALRLARNNALNLQVNTVICPLSKQATEECSNDKDFNANWSYGWLIYTDFNNNKQLDSTDSIVRLNELEGSVNVIFNQRGILRFFSDGSARSAGFYVCKEATSENRHIKLLYTGRSRTTSIVNEKQQSICLSPTIKK